MMTFLWLYAAVGLGFFIGTFDSARDTMRRDPTAMKAAFTCATLAVVCMVGWPAIVFWLWWKAGQR